jgi:glycine/D-amino acid oxidase-like deaminating enzyme
MKKNDNNNHNLFSNYTNHKEENYKYQYEIKTSGNTQSSWFNNIQYPLKYDKLNRNISTFESIDVIIVGGGIAGLSIAYLLSKAGKNVVVFDDGYLGSGETSRTTAHITHALDDRYYNLEQLHGNKGAYLAAESHTSAINLIESIVKEEKIDCDFERLDGFLFLDSTDTKESLEKELKATHRAGITNTQLISKVPQLSFDIGPCLYFPNQAQFQPLKYLKGLSKAIISYGGEIFTETHVQDILPSLNQIKTLDGYTVNATNIVIATNAPIIDKVSKIYDKQQAYRTYVIGAKIKKNIIPKSLYWDTGNQNSENTVAPYHYVRIQRRENNSKYDLLIVGGEDHLTGSITDDKDIEQRYTSLELWTKSRFPIEEIEFRWSGQVLEPKDGIAFIGQNPGDEKNVYIATGDSGNGITHGTIAGIILSDLILGINNPWALLYNPSRIPKEKSALSQDSENVKKEDNNNNIDNKDGQSTNKKNEDNKKIKSMLHQEELNNEQGMVKEEEKIVPANSNLDKNNNNYKKP